VRVVRPSSFNHSLFFASASAASAESVKEQAVRLADVVHRFKLVDRGIKRARWSVLTGCSRPSILFEGGFVTNSQDCRLIASPTYRDAIATAIGDAVVNYRKALQPRVVGPSGR
jgi:N-acetylmuramoyl-L-alanine amidase